ncbi:DUF4214 domain-containing protein [Subtercola sp. YIM 133946]|uniref:DUF4214 domain-containing protein n=1 Tax=Subtercola sp. YIM 133946 TaxID=3118909 RepID=UPI002F91DDB8
MKRRLLSSVVALALATASLTLGAEAADAAPATPFASVAVPDAAATSYTVSGRVTLSGGRPATTGTVAITYLGYVDASEGWTDGYLGTKTFSTAADGSYSIPVAPCAAVVIEVTPTYPQTGGGYLTTFNVPFTIASLPTDAGMLHPTKTPSITGVDVSMTPAAQVTGRVTDLSGKPVANEPVSLFAKNATTGAYDVLTSSTQTDANGAYSTDHVAVGDYNVFFGGSSWSVPDSTGTQPQWYGTQASTLDTGTPFTLAAGQVRTADQVMTKPAGMSGSIQCDDCGIGDTITMSLEGLDPTTSTWMPLSHYISVQQWNSSYSITDLVPGSYRLTVGLNGTYDSLAQTTGALVVASGSTLAQNVTFTPDLSKPRIVPAVAGVSSNATTYVNALYWDYLKRLPSTADVAWWGSQIDRGQPRSSIAQGFVNSDEYRLMRIDAAYVTILGRPTDQNGGRQSWLDGMKRGLLTTDDVEKSFYASDEYFRNSGGTNAAFVSSLYSTLLHRTGSAADYSWWASLAQAHGRLWVVTNFWSTAETVAARVSSMYQHYLGRVPDATGLAGWVNFGLTNGDTALRAGFTQSDEYFARSQARFSVR